MTARNVWIVFWDAFTESVKTKRALILIISYMFMIFVGMKIGSMLEIFSWALAGSRQSFSVVLPMYITIIVLPLFAIIISYNIISEEISQGSIKFMACRIDRFSIIAGNVLSSFVL